MMRDVEVLSLTKLEISRFSNSKSKNNANFDVEGTMYLNLLVCNYNDIGLFKK
jgi:hypothetical protein